MIKNPCLEIRELTESEIPEALKLVWEVFLEFEAPEYSKEGVEEFHNFIDDSNQVSNLRILGALNNNRIIGVLATRSNHISLFFVKKELHKKGIGKCLFNYINNEDKYNEFTVNSSPYAKDIYEKLGFSPTNIEQIKNGIRFIPMIYKKS